MCKGKQKAYMTIEATLLFPVIFGAIIFTIYMGIYLYNTSVIKQISYVAALRGSQLLEVAKEEIELFVEQQLKELIEQKLLAQEVTQWEIKVSMGKIKVKVDMEMKVPFMEGISFIKKIWRISGEAEVIRINPVDVIRGKRRINESQISE